MNDYRKYPVTPEKKALQARRTLVNATTAMCLCARGNGVTDDRIKALILAMRTPEIAVLTDVEVADLIHHLEIESA